MSNTIENKQTENGGIEMQKVNLELGEEQAVMYGIEDIYGEHGELKVGTQLQIDGVSRAFAFYLSVRKGELDVTVESLETDIRNLVPLYVGLLEAIKSSEEVLGMLSSAFESAKDYLNSAEMQEYFEMVPYTPEGNSVKELAFKRLSNLKESFFSTNVNKRWVFE